MKVRVIECLSSGWLKPITLGFSYNCHVYLIFTTLQKLAARINGTILAKIISSFIILTGTRHIFAGIDSTGFKVTHASEYYTERAKLRRRKYTKLSIGADLLQQIICNIKIRRAPTRHDNIDFKPIVKRIANIIPLSVVTADKAYDSEDSHLLVREELGAFSVIPARHKDVPILNTHGRYRKQMKLGYHKILYSQRNKDETIISVIKRLFGEHLMSRLIRTQNRELYLRCIAYNMHRLTNLIIILMVSTKPNDNRIIFLLDTIKNIVGALGVLNKYNFLRFIIIRLVFWYRLLS